MKRMVKLLEALAASESSTARLMAECTSAAKAMGKRGWKKFRAEFMAERFPLKEGETRTEKQRDEYSKWSMRLMRVERATWPLPAPKPEPVAKKAKAKALANIIELFKANHLTLDEVVRALAG